MRTTSSLESFNSKLNRCIPRKANFFKFIEGLRIVECEKSFVFYNSANDINVKKDEKIKRKRKEDQKRDEKILRLSDLLNNRKITIKQFLNGMALETDNDSNDYNE